MPSTGEPKQNPRTTRVRQVVLDAAIELLLNCGAGEVTATRVADETGVARTTIYRHWPDQPSLLLATIEALVAPHSATLDSGDLRADLTTTLTRLRTRLETRQVRPVFSALVDHASRDDAFVAAQRRFVEGLTQPTIDVLEAGHRRGDLHSAVDVAEAAARLTGPLFHQHLLMLTAITDELIADVVAQFMTSNSDAD
ncbi:MAG: TetR/AcrR family transcriptional regulator [Actinomycetota bacterium]